MNVGADLIKSRLEQASRDVGMKSRLEQQASRDVGMNVSSLISHTSLLGNSPPSLPSPLPPLPPSLPLLASQSLFSFFVAAAQKALAFPCAYICRDSDRPTTTNAKPPRTAIGDVGTVR